MKRFRGNTCLLKTLLTFAALGAVVVAPATTMAESTPTSARAGLDLADDAAFTWAEDARLLYIENDERLNGDGTATRWGYLYNSPSKGEYRCYSLEDGKIRVATDLGFLFDAPPLPDEWVDSREAYLAAEKSAGTDYRIKETGSLSTMLLVRGVLHQEDPDAATWAVVYTSPSAPALIVVVDAATGKVLRTWRG